MAEGATIESLQIEISALSTDAEKSLQSLKATLDGLKTVCGKGAGLNSITNPLSKLRAELAKMTDADVERLKGLTEALKGLEGLEKLSISPEIAKQIKEINSALSYGSRNSNSNSDPDSLLSRLGKFASFGMIAKVASKLGIVIASFIDKSNSYIEDLNLFNASLGQYAQQAQEYAEKVGDLMGIDPGKWMRNQGVFQTLAEGFGVASDRAYIMSKNLTQLGYDLSSFFNIAVDGTGGSMQKLQAGLSGELEPLRRLGFDLSEARLKAVALSLGIDQTFNSMTQAQKAQLRYYAIMTQVTTAQGDMARTLDTPSNQLRVLKAQVEQAARAIGNIFIPILNALLPYVVAAANVIRLLAEAIASLFGFKLPEVDYSGISGAGAAAGTLDDNLKSAGKSAKKAKELLADWDELNIIQSETSSGSGSGSGSGGGGGGFDWELPEYDFLAGLAESRVGKIMEWVKNNMDIIYSLAVGIGAAFLTWKISKLLGKSLGETIKYTAGIGLAAFGAAELFQGMLDQMTNGVDWNNFRQVVWGATAIVAGLGIMFGLTGLAAGLLAVGAVLAINPLKELITTGEMSDASLTQLSIAIGAVGLAFAILTGGWIPLAIAGIAIAVAWIVQKWYEIKLAFETAWQAISDWWNTNIQPAIDSAVAWVDTNIVQPVSGFFEDLDGNIQTALTSIGEFFTGLWEDTLYPVVSWIDMNIIQPIGEFFTALWGTIQGDEENNLGVWWNNLWNGQIFPMVQWIDDNIIQPIGGFFSALWGIITGDEENNLGTWWNTLWNETIFPVVSWIDENITTPISGFFSTLSADMKSFMEDPIASIESAWEAVATWFHNNVTAPIANFFIDCMNGVIDAINFVIRGLNSMNFTIPGVNVFGQQLWDDITVGINGIQEIARIARVETYARGGFPKFGDLFVANENGAEMVGSFGNRTGVANNDQIIAGIAGGVRGAISPLAQVMRDALPYLSTSPRLVTATGYYGSSDYFGSGATQASSIRERSAIVGSLRDTEFAEEMSMSNEGVENRLNMVNQALDRILSKEFKAKIVPSTALARTVKRSEEMRRASEGV